MNEKQNIDVEELAGQIDLGAFLSDMFLYQALIEHGGHMIVSKEDTVKIDEMRRTRSIEFTAEESDDGKVNVHARFVYRGEETGYVENDNDN